VEGKMKTLKKFFNILKAFLNDVECPKCKSHNLKLEDYSVVNPESIRDAVYIAEGYSIAAACGAKSAEGNYKKTISGNIYQTRDERYICYNCDNKFTTRREVTIASAP
jgi:hypothetical protein